MSISRGGKRGYPPEFRAQAVELYRSSGLSFTRVAADLGVSVASLKIWVKQAEIDAGEREGLVSAEREELVALRRENRVLREEREILKKQRPFSSRRARPGERVQVYRCGKGLLLRQDDVSCALCQPCWILRLAGAEA
jgi:transposase